MTEINESIPNKCDVRENQVFVSVDLKYKEGCLHVNRFQWLSSYMHNFVNNS